MLAQFAKRIEERKKQEEEKVDTAAILRKRILARRKALRTSTSLANAGLQALSLTMRREGRVILKEDKVLALKNKTIGSNVQGKIRDSIVREDTISRGLVGCAKQQLQMELYLKREEGVARPHIRSQLPKVRDLHERMSRLRNLIRKEESVSTKEKMEDSSSSSSSASSSSSSRDVYNSKNDDDDSNSHGHETSPSKQHAKDCGINRVSNELSVVKTPITLTKPCPHCGQEFVESLLTQHMRACVLWRGKKGRAEKSSSHSQRLTRYLAENAPQVCPHCCHRIPQNRYEKHVVTCKTIQEHSKSRIRLEARRAGVDVNTGCRRPGIPTRLVATPISSDRLRITWTRPIFDGGFPVREYVVKYRLRHEHRIGKRKWYTFDEPIEIRTSHWCLNNPVCHHGIVIEGLLANQSYANISVVAWNEMGYGERSEELEVVTMPDPTPPSPPKHLAVVAEYSDSIRLRWALPHSNGGSPLAFVEIEYQSLEWEDLTNKRSVQTLNTIYGSEGGRRWMTHVLRAKSDVLAFSIQNLSGDCEYRNIRARMTNEANLRSPWSNTIEFARTPPATKVQLLVNELNRTHAMTHAFIDSDLFREKYPQRYSKEAYLELVHDELKMVVASRYRTYQADEEILRALEDRGLPSNALAAFAESVTSLIWIFCRQLHPSHVLLKLDKAPYANGRFVCDKCGERQNGRDYSCVICGIDFCEACVRKADPLLLSSDGDGGDMRSGIATNVLCGARHDAMRGKIIAGEVSSGNNSTTNATSASSEYELRKKHFLFRIDKIKKSIGDAKADIDRLVRERMALERTNTHVYDDVRKIKLELERVQLTKAAVVDTSIVHGEPQRYSRERLVQILKERLVELQSSIIVRNKKMLDCQRTIARKEEHIEGEHRSLQLRRAAMMAFEKEKVRKDRANAILSRVSKSAVPRAFNAWVQAVQSIKSDREICRVCFSRMIQRKVFSAFGVWKQLKASADAMIASTKAVSGIGSRMLVKSQHQRVEVRDEVQKLLSGLAVMKHNIDLADLSSEQVKRFETSALFETTDIARRMGPQAKDPKSAEALLAQADGYLNMDEYRKAIPFLEACVTKYKIRGEPQGMGAAYGRMGSAMRRLGEPQKALLCYQRQAGLAKEAGDIEGKALASMRMGEIHVALGQLRHGLHEVEESVSGWLKLRDSRREAIAYRLLARIHRLMDDEESSHLGASKYERLADEIESALSSRLREGIDETDKLVRRMVGVQAEDAEVIPLQQCTMALPKLRRKRLLLTRKRDELAVDKREAYRLKPKLTKHMSYCRARLAKAMNSQYTEMDSDFLHKGLFQRFKVTELIETIEKEISKTQKELDHIEKEHRGFEIAIRNCDDDIQELDRYTVVEESALMRKVVSKRLSRDIAFNRSNLEAYDVSGSSTGGIQNVVVAVRKSILVFDLLSGKCINMFGADDEESHVGGSKGHTRQITCLYFREENVYSGSVDCDVRVWHIDRDECVATLRGHRGSVWAVHATFDRVISAAADRDIRIWGGEAEDWRCLKTVSRGHSKTVRVIEGVDNQFVTGGADGRVILWDIKSSENEVVHKIRKKCKLLGHGCSVSAIAFTKTSLISGDARGTIISWDTHERRVLRRFEGGHRGAVTAIQFDESKIVSAGKDHNVVIHDIASGRCLMTLHGHSGIVKALQFDKHTILTASFDGTMRKWPIRERKDRASAEEDARTKKTKYHIVESSDTVLSLAKKFGVSIRAIRSWNDIKDTQDTWIGQRVIVRVEDEKGMVLESAKINNVHRPKGARAVFDHRGALRSIEGSGT